MKKFSLPKHAFKCVGKELVAGHMFEDGVKHFTDDVAAKVHKVLTRFYGCKVEDVAEPTEESNKSENGANPGLTVDSTKAPAPAPPKA